MPSRGPFRWFCSLRPKGFAMCRHRSSNRWKPGAEPEARPPRRRRGFRWPWLFLVAVFILPWSWACDKGNAQGARRGVRFALELKTKETEETLRKVKEQLEELKKQGKLTGLEFDVEFAKAEKALRGAREAVEESLEQAADAAAAAADLSQKLSAQADSISRGAAPTRVVVMENPKPAPPPKRPPAPPKPAGTPRASVRIDSSDKNPVWEIELDPKDEEGFSSDPERAKANVLAKAARRIGEWIRDHCADCKLSSFEPDAAFMRKWNIVRSGPTEFEVSGMEGRLPGGGDKVWNARVVVELAHDTQLALAEAGRRSQEEFRLEKAWGRQGVAASAMGLLVLAALGVLAYFHLDDRTRGYWSKPLAALLAALVMGLGLFLFRRF